MRRTAVLVMACLGIAVLARGADDARRRWWAHIQFLADDGLEGRETGSEGHRKAAEYVAAQFAKAGLQPAGDAGGYLQSVAFNSRRIVEARSSLALESNGRLEPLTLGDDATFNMRVAPAARVRAPLAFVGYGLTVPEAGHDDLAGQDLKGKVAVFFTGGPESIPGPLLAHYQSAGERWVSLKRAGAIGALQIQNPRGQDVPWERSKLARLLPAMALADAAFDETAGQQLAVTVNPERAATLFEGSGRAYADLLGAATSRKPLDRFALAKGVVAEVAFEPRSLTSQNVVGVRSGADPKLKAEYVVVSAHLDHLGIGEPIDGDRINNGAMDNASGIATLIETAAALEAAKAKLRRSVLFVAVTAEEKGLLGSRYFASKPTVPATAIVADLNIDMFQPHFPMTSLIVQGLDESDLGDDLRKLAGPLRIGVLGDPEPERNAFTRSDQYSFIKRGVPSLALKVGFVKDSPEHEIVKKWRKERYHSPSDDLQQPGVDLQAAVDFGRVYVKVVEAIANRDTRPNWKETSFFKRFAK
jgi:Zn-dependent M28 family amino/carboxypeptidase